MKKISIILLSALMCLVLLVPCFAANTNGSVVDMADIISEQDEDSLSRYIHDIASRTGVNIYIVTEARDNEDDGASGVAYDFEANLSGSYIILADEETSNKAMILASQDLVDDIGYEDDKAIISATLEDWYAPEDTYNCCMIFLSMTDSVLSAHYGVTDTTQVSDTTEPVDTSEIEGAMPDIEITNDFALHIWDIAEQFTQEQYEVLDKRAKELTQKTGTFVAILVQDLGTDDEQTVHDYCADLYNDYIKTDKAIICSLDPVERYVNIFASDSSSFTESCNDHIFESVKDAMSGNDNWYGGAIAFLNAVDSMHDNGYSVPKEPFNWFKNIVIDIVVGLIISLIVVMILKGQLKSVVHKTGAREYVKEGTFNLTNERDIFLYNTVTRTAIPKNNSSGASHASGGGGHSSGGHV